jgi:hypothetical protein
MRNTVRVVIILLISLMFSSCMVSSFPEGNSLSLSTSQTQLFLVTASKPAIPSNSSLHYNWSIDGDFKVDNAMFYYSPSLSDVGNVVVIMCHVVVTNDRNGTIISSDVRKWDVTIIP